MINAEKYKDEIIEEYQNLLKRNVIDGDGNRMNKAIKTIAYKHCGKQLCGASSTFKWLCEEYKEPIKVSKLEYDILTYILKNTECKYITRNKSRSLCVHSYKPVKDTQYGKWTAVCDKVKSCEVFNNLFPFIKWEDEEPTSILEVLENCEVVNDAEE